MTLTDEQISRALDGTYLGRMFDYITIWEGDESRIEVRPTPELRELAGIFHTLGREAGLREAAGIANTLFARKSYKSVGAKLSEAILAVIPSPPNIGEGEQCEWTQVPIQGRTMWQTSCGYLVNSRHDASVCRHCSKPIKVKE